MGNKISRCFFFHGRKISNFVTVIEPTFKKGGVNGQVVRVVSLKSLAPLCWVQILPGILDFFMWRSYLASLQNVGCSTHVHSGIWNSAWRGIWGLSPPKKIERRHITSIELVWHILNHTKIKPTKNIQENKLVSVP